MIERTLEKAISDKLKSGKAVIVLGPRQVGKTTIMQAIAKAEPGKSLWLNCDEPDVRASLENASSTSLKALFGQADTVMIDEAQRIKDIGLLLKLIVDNKLISKLLVSGSSALELANQVFEPLTGRKREFTLLPFSSQELAEHTSEIEEKRLLHRRLVFGFYPEVVKNPGEEAETLQEISNSYLYKDLLGLSGIRKPEFLEKLLQALALQLGSEVSFQELGRLIGADTATVEKYITLLEQAFVIFRLKSFKRNLRNELKKSRKIYFWDNGIRNAILKNFNQTSLRSDIGALWENFLISERLKFKLYHSSQVNSFFWRTIQQQEIDYLEEAEGQLKGFEFKWNLKSKARVPKTFEEAYPEAKTYIIHSSNYWYFIHGKEDEIKEA